MATNAKVPYIKTEGAGNTCLVVHRKDFPGTDAALPDFVRAICAKDATACDQLLLVQSTSPLSFDIWNADGSTSKMCGNGSRAILRLAEEDGWLKQESAQPGSKVELTVSGRAISAERLKAPGSYEVNLGQPNVSARADAIFDGIRVPYWPVDIGNQHAVLFCGTRQGDWKLPPGFSLALWGLKLCDSLNRNIEFVLNVGTKDDARAKRQVALGHKRPEHPYLQVLVWEIGAGPTLACGSGAVAVAAAWQKRNKSLQPQFTVEMGGGVLEVRLTPFGGFLSGPSSILERGEFAYVS